MKWFKKFFGRNDYSSDQTKFAVLHMAAGGLRGMMMLVGRNKIHQDTVYIRLPETMASSFPGYEVSGPPDEAEVSGAYGDQGDLDQYIKRRR